MLIKINIHHHSAPVTKAANNGVAMNAGALFLALLLVGPSAQAKDVSVQVKGALCASTSLRLGSPTQQVRRSCLRAASVLRAFATIGRDSADQRMMANHRRLGTSQQCCTTRSPLLALGRRMY